MKTSKWISIEYLVSHGLSAVNADQTSLHFSLCDVYFKAIVTIFITEHQLAEQMPLSKKLPEAPTF